MRDADAARLLEEALSNGAAGPVGGPPGLAGRLEIAAELRAASAAWASDVPAAAGTFVIAHRQAIPSMAPPAVPFFWHRALIATPGVVLLLVSLMTAIPGAGKTFARPLVQILQSVLVGGHTELSQFGPQDAGEVDRTLGRFRSDLAAGSHWFVHTGYVGMGGNVPPGKSSQAVRIETVAELTRVSDVHIHAPRVGSIGLPAEFTYAFVAPDGMVMAFFGEGDNEVLMIEAPVGNGLSVGFSRVIVGPEGSVSPELRTETVTADGQDLVWDPDPTGRMPLTSSLHWEADGVSYSIFGRSLTKERAVQIFESLEPL
ncbi:MAG: hypothetical protein IT184_17710 [Acidobacteria bacterium]|nr:hypothetical protein [Acidobacteriota bacterium]